jgi:hypothetical protein
MHDDMAVEFFLSFVLGTSSTHGVGACLDDVEWRRYCKRLTCELEKYIATNVVTDRDHDGQIRTAISKLKRATRPGLDPRLRERILVVALLELSLLLLGDLPNHRKRKKINRPEHYLLNKYRSLHYSQMADQKAKLLGKFYEPFAVESPVKTRIWNEYDLSRRQIGGSARFVEWFHKNYPAEYEKLLG